MFLSHSSSFPRTLLMSALPFSPATPSRGRRVTTRHTGQVITLAASRPDCTQLSKQSKQNVCWQKRHLAFRSLSMHTEHSNCLFNESITSKGAAKAMVNFPFLFFSFQGKCSKTAAVAVYTHEHVVLLWQTRSFTADCSLSFTYRLYSSCHVPNIIYPSKTSRHIYDRIACKSILIYLKKKNWYH